ncbi:uncharacterized protein [Argopecten irradians]|uniref:uncharacterized protein n=1 Tax=Argopecten irradians TaxID=31199 RepID=UPI003712A07C
MAATYGKTSDYDRIKRMMNVPRPFRKYIYCQIITGFLFIYLWYSFNGGLIPWFLRHNIPVLKMGPDINTLYFFPHTSDDGSRLKWYHGANTPTLLQRSLQTDVDMIEGDVMLKGQGTDSQTLLPVMGEPLAKNSGDMPFEDWLTTITPTGKGIKIDIQSTDAIEITLQTLKKHKAKIRVPLWIHANIFKGPLGGEPPVDGTRFIKHVQRLFPQCTLSLGWTSGTHTDLSLVSYTWKMVIDMYHFVHEHELEPPLVFTVRASMMHNSVPQIKWLTDNTRASLLVWNSLGDKVVTEDFMHLAFKFPPHNLYFDLQDKQLSEFVVENRHVSKDKVNPLVLQRETVVFKPEAWVKMGLHIEQHSILPSEEAIVLTTKTVYILTKNKYKPRSMHVLHGRVQFLNIKDKDVVEKETGLNIYMRPTGYADFENIVGIRCFIGVDGLLEIQGSNLKRVKDFKKTHRITAGTSNCFRFSIQDTGNEIVMKVNVLHNCETLESTRRDEDIHAEFKVPIPANVGIDQHPFILKLEDSNRYAVLDELYIKYSQ